MRDAQAEAGQSTQVSRSVLASQRLAVVVQDPIESHCRRLCAALASAGYEARPSQSEPSRLAPDDLRLILTCSCSEDSLEVQALVERRPELQIVVQCRNSDHVLDARLIASGASAVVPYAGDPRLCVLALRATEFGLAVMPQDVARGARMVPPVTTVGDMTAEERVWLAALAAGVSVARIARESHYSTRAMFRHLTAVYRKLGAGGRAEAIAAAARLGLLIEEGPRG